MIGAISKIYNEKSNLIKKLSLPTPTFVASSNFDSNAEFRYYQPDMKYFKLRFIWPKDSDVDYFEVIST